MRAVVNVGLLALLVVSMAANVALRPDPSKPNIEILPDMVHTVAYASFSPNPDLPGGKTLQTPVPGTMPRGYEPVHYQPTPEDAARAARELKNPLDTKQAKERGVFVYQTYCTPCHGPSLRGDGPVALHGYPAPPNLRGEKSMNVAEGQMFHILTFGQKNMPSYESQLTVNDRWSVIAYVRAMQHDAGTAPVQEAKK